jgi:PD-(D/E)XK nuclease superfamily
MGGWRNLAPAAVILPLPVQPSLLHNTTPTRAESLRSCMLRAAYDASPSYALLRVLGPGARIGTVCHAILEAAGRGHFDGMWPNGWRDEFSLVWTEQIHRQEEQVQRSPLERHFGPAERWPKYELKRAYTQRKVQQLAESRARMWMEHAASAGGAEQLERSYEGFGGKLRGRADHVVRQRGHISIEDYKSGVVAVETEDGVLEVKADYRRQLLLYAALHWDETGEWPSIGRLIPLKGEPILVDIEPEFAMTVVEETLAKLKEYNRLAASSAPLTSFANPTSDNCRGCPYKAACTPFWEAVSEKWDLHGAYIAGSVAGVEGCESEVRVVRVDATSGTLPPGQYRLRELTKERFPNIDALIPGTNVRVIGAHVENCEEPLDLLSVVYTQLWEAWSQPREAAINTRR